MRSILDKRLILLLVLQSLLDKLINKFLRRDVRGIPIYIVFDWVAVDAKKKNGLDFLHIFSLVVFALLKWDRFEILFIFDIMLIYYQLEIGSIDANWIEIVICKSLIEFPCPTFGKIKLNTFFRGLKMFCIIVSEVIATRFGKIFFHPLCSTDVKCPRDVLSLLFLILF